MTAIDSSDGKHIQHDTRAWSTFIDEQPAAGDISDSEDKKKTSQPYLNNSCNDITNQAQPSPPSTSDLYNTDVLPKQNDSSSNSTALTQQRRRQ